MIVTAQPANQRGVGAVSALGRIIAAAEKQHTDAVATFCESLQTETGEPNPAGILVGIRNLREQIATWHAKHLVLALHPTMRAVTDDLLDAIARALGVDLAALALPAPRRRGRPRKQPASGAVMHEEASPLIEDLIENGVEGDWFCERLQTAIEALRTAYRSWRAAAGVDTLLVDAGVANAEQAEILSRLQLFTVEDLLYYAPRAIRDHTAITPIADLVVGTEAVVVGRIISATSYYPGRSQNHRGQRSFLEHVPIHQPASSGGLFRLYVMDDTGKLFVQFSNANSYQKTFRVDDRVRLSGRVGGSKNTPSLLNPWFEPWLPIDGSRDTRIVPIYGLTRGLREHMLRSLIAKHLQRYRAQVSDPLPADLQEAQRLCSLDQALHDLHDAPTLSAYAAARRRLAFDQVVGIQLGLQAWRRSSAGKDGTACPRNDETERQVLEALPFTLTGAQQKAIAIISNDLAQPAPMARLLLGDVGSGKTAVAAAAVVQVVAAGHQAAILAPTEILAEQHYRSLRRMVADVQITRSQAEPEAEGHGDPELGRRIGTILSVLGLEDAGPRPIRIERLTGSMSMADRRRVRAGLADGTIDVIIGTHALISNSVRYASVALVVVDEQHRFGVQQREALRAKGRLPHLLMMTATPIPRTMMQAIYGDLDLSLLDELPPGRKPIRTRVLSEDDREEAYREIEAAIRAGRQAFVICPRIDIGDEDDMPSLTSTREALMRRFPGESIGVLHGELSPATKDAVMTRFRDERAYSILCATSVVEVGIDVPNATCIVILGSDSFGLAQLHQFRGRVGRGEFASCCILVTASTSDKVRRRLAAMEQIHDGFRLAEIDLEMRGPGELFGEQQSGRVAGSAVRGHDVRLVAEAQDVASKVLAKDPDLCEPGHAGLKALRTRYWVRAELAR